MKFFSALMAILLIASCGVLKPNSDAPRPEGPSLLEMFPVSELNQKSEPQIPTLIGGRNADPKDWPASMYSAQGNSRCTSTIVGERVLLIAAHCVANGGTAQFKVGGKNYSARCEHSPDYRRDSTADWSLCLISEKVEGIPYEIVNQDEALVKVGDEVLLTGFGCVRPGGGGGNDGTYRIGETKVQRVTNGNNDIVTKGGAALCFGDSGGPAFKYLDAEKKIRAQISVNSRGDIATTSYLSAVHTGPAKKFLKEWSDRKQVKICGVHADAAGCRGGSVPDPDSECRKKYNELGKCLFGENRLVLTQEGRCKEVFASLMSCVEQAIWDSSL